MTILMILALALVLYAIVHLGRFLFGMALFLLGLVMVVRASSALMVQYHRMMLATHSALIYASTHRLEAAIAGTLLFLALALIGIAGAIVVRRTMTMASFLLTNARLHVAAATIVRGRSVTAGELARKAHVSREAAIGWLARHPARMPAFAES